VDTTMTASSGGTRAFPAASALPRAALLVALVAVLVVALGGGQAFWVCLPAALLACASAPSPAAAVVVAAIVVVAAAVPEIVSAALGPLPPPPLVIAVAGMSVAVVVALRRRIEREHEALRRSALRDPLTGLANRRALAERLDYEVARHARQGHPFAVVALDLDGFKAVNDRFGHQAGDDLLRDVGRALAGVVRDQDTIARLGGDEFCVLAPETGEDGARRLAQRAADAIGRVTTGLEALSASVGHAVFPDDGGDGAEVLAAADAASLALKRRGRGGREVERSRPAA
jgi:diguanylate cyclase (GGDEF)-like protein